MTALSNRRCGFVMLLVLLLVVLVLLVLVIAAVVAAVVRVDEMACGHNNGELICIKRQLSKLHSKLSLCALQKYEKRQSEKEEFHFF